MLKCLLFLSASLALPVLDNGSFEQGTQGWVWSQQEQARGEFVVVTGDSPVGGRMARVTPTVNAATHRLQLFHPFPLERLEMGRIYVLRFYARAKEPTAFPVNILGQKRPWPRLAYRTVEVDREWREFFIPFRARPIGQSQARVDFFLGAVPTTVWLDGVRIEPYEPPPLNEGPALEGPDFTVRFDAAGGIARLVHRSTGQVLVREEWMGPVYELTFQDAEGRSFTFPGPRQARAERLSDGWRFVAEDKRARVTMTYRLSGGGLEIRVAAENKTPQALVAVRFPILRLPLKLGERGEDDRLLWPLHDGGEMDDPGTTLTQRPTGLAHTYPGPLSCQVMAFYDPTAGLYVATHDAEGYPKRFAVRCGLQPELSITHLGPSLPGASLRPPYPVHLATFVGDWTAAAERYRRWSERQLWARKKVATRTDTPNWLRRGALVTIFDPHWARKNNLPPLEPLRSLLQDFGRFGISLLVNNRGWERYGAWCGQEYLPPYPSPEAFRGAAQLIRRSGGQGMLMLSGYRWTMERTSWDGSLYSSAERFEQEVKPFVTCDAKGRPIIHEQAKEDWRGRRWAQLCRATEFAKNAILEVARYGVEAGYAVIHFDQEVSGGYYQALCYSRQHGHLPGHGRWVHEAMADLYERLNATCRPLDPDFALSMEEPNELYLPWLNLCQSRPFGITNEWPAPPPLTRSVPLFCFLYHDCLIGWAAFYPWKADGHPEYSLAKGFAVGLMPGLVPEGRFRQPQRERDREYIEFLQRCLEGYRGFAHDYLLFGRMEQPLPLHIPERVFPRGANRPPIRVPAVFHSVWSLPDGRLGVVFINPEAKPHELVVDLHPLGMNEGVPLRIVSARKGEQKRVGMRFRLSLAARDLVLVEGLKAVQAGLGRKREN